MLGLCNKAHAVYKLHCPYDMVFVWNTGKYFTRSSHVTVFNSPPNANE